MIADLSIAELAPVMLTNALSPMLLIESFSGSGRSGGMIAVMSSGQGGVANNLSAGCEAYRASQVGAHPEAQLRPPAGDPRTRLLMAPGRVRADMSGADARLSIEESIPDLLTVIGAQAGHGSFSVRAISTAPVPAESRGCRASGTGRKHRRRGQRPRRAGGQTISGRCRGRRRAAGPRPRSAPGRQAHPGALRARQQPGPRAPDGSPRA